MQNSPQAVANQYTFIDLGKIVACLAVISIHAFTWNTVTLVSGPVVDWWAQQIVLSFTIWAVPLFIMMSGASILTNSSENITIFWQKRWKRIGIPTLIWLSVYTVFFAWQRGDILTLQSLLLKPIIGPFEHLYFLIILLGLAVCTPTLRAMVQKLTRNELLFFCVVFFWIAMFWQRSRFSGTMFVPYLGYYLWGAWLISWQKTFRWRTLLSSGLMLTLTILLGTVWSSHWNESWYVQDPLWYRHWNPVVSLLSTVVWLMLRKTEEIPFIKSVATQTIIKNLAEHTFGMYLNFLLIQASLLTAVWFFWPNLDLRWYHSALLIPVSAGISYLAISIWKHRADIISQ